MRLIASLTESVKRAQTVFGHLKKVIFLYIWTVVGICYNEVLLHDVDQCNFNDLIILKLNLRKEDIKK